MRTKRLFLAVCWVLVLGLFFAGCAPGTTLAPAAKTAPALPTEGPALPELGAFTPTPRLPAEEPKYGGILNVAATTDPPSLDIQQETNYLVHLPMECDYSGLLQYDPLENDKIIGDLAERWELSPDGLAYTFYLHKGVKWHDGQPMTSEDVKFSLDRMRNPPKNILSPTQPLLAPIRQVETLDKDTVKVTLNYPSPSIISFLGIGQMVIYPKHFVEAHGDMKKSAMGTGPYKLKRYNMGVSVEHVKNPDYFVKGRPYLDGINFYLIKDRASRSAAFRTKQIHLATGHAGPAVSEIEYLQKNYPEAIVKSYPSLSQYEVRALTTKPPYNDDRVRKAIYLALDRQAAIKVVGQGDGSLGGPLPPYGPFGIPQDELLKLPGYRQPKDADIGEAKRLLAEAGYAQGFKAELLVRQGADEENFGVFMKGQLAGIGVDANVKVVDAAIRAQLLSQRAFDILLITYGLKTLDPDDISRYFLKGAPQNYNDFYDEKVEELFGKQSRAIDPAERKKIALELQRRLLDIGGAIISFWSNYRLSKWPFVRSYEPGLSFYNINKYQDVWLAR